MFLRNAWYVAGWSRDLTDKPLAVRMLDEPIVVWRMANGMIAALEDRCPHRHLPLSMGTPVEGGIRCAYHGMVMDERGACVGVASQSFAPPNAQVKAYPATERYGWIWVWMGNAALADPVAIPDFHELTEPGFAAVGKTNRIACDYRLVTDNLLDLSHVGYVHVSTIGTPEFAQKGALRVQRTGRGVRVVRVVPDVPPPPTYIKTGVLPAGKTIDRWQIIDFIAPSFVRIHVGGAEAGTGALEGRYEHGLNIWVLNAITPETATTANYHWASARRHALDNPQADALFLGQVGEAFEEDRIVLEAQQRVLAMREDSWSVALKADAGSIEARRVLEKLIADEVGGARDVAAQIAGGSNETRSL